MNTRLCTLIAAAAIGFAAPTVSAQTTWDMPTPYPAANFHTENIMQFAGEVDKATAGKLKITVHAGGSLFKANEIKRALQGGQAQIGEIILGGYANENPLFGLDNVPFLATSGHIFGKPNQQRGRSEGCQVARLQPANLAHRRAGRSTASDHPGRGALAGAGHRGRGRFHDFGRDRLRQQGVGTDQVFL